MTDQDSPRSPLYDAAVQIVGTIAEVRNRAPGADQKELAALVASISTTLANAIIDTDKMREESQRWREHHYAAVRAEGGFRNPLMQRLLVVILEHFGDRALSDEGLSHLADAILRGHDS